MGVLTAVQSLSPVRLLATPWTAAHQAPLSMGFSRQECWSGVPLPSLDQTCSVVESIILDCLQSSLDFSVMSYGKIQMNVWPIWCLHQSFLKYQEKSLQFSSIQSLSLVQLFATPWTAACQASLSLTNSRSLLKLMSIRSVMRSSPLILCRHTFFC